MTPTKLLHDFLENLGIITLVALLFEFVLRSSWPRWCKHAATGLVFAAGAIASMASPSEVVPGLFFDMRHAFILLAGALGGWLAVSIVTISAAAFRLFVVGGAATHVGLAGIAISCAIAVLLAQVSPLSNAPYRRLSIYGAAASASLLSILLLPWGTALHVLSTAGIPFIVGNWLGVVCAGHIVSYQLLRDRAERDLLTDSLVDALTGVLNRRGFESVASEQFARAKERGRPLAVLMADIDHFKRINDSFGHLVGDQVLSTVSRLIGSAARRTDPVSRYGGEEFAVFVPDADRARALQVAGRIVGAVRTHPFRSDFADFPVTISVGVFIVEPGFSGTLRDAIQEADRAVYRAKRNGRDRVELSVVAPAMETGRPARPAI